MTIRDIVPPGVRQRRLPQSRPWQSWEVLAPSLGFASLVISCLIASPKKYFWNDELYSHYLLGDPSFFHMLGAFHDKINNTPPLYFFVGWMWAQLFGADELSLRLLSSLGVGVACIVVWLTLRRTFSFVATSIGVFTAFFSFRVLAQNVEGRMYGMFLAACAAGLGTYSAINRRREPGGGLLLWNALVHAAMVNTHLHGLFYSAAILVSHVVRDRSVKVFRPRVYLSVALGWSSLVFYLPSFLIQADAGRPRDWLTLPTAGDLISVLSISSRSPSGGIDLTSLLILSFFLLILMVSLLSFYRRSSGTTDPGSEEQHHAEFSLVILACAFWLVPVAVWIISYAVKPIFWDRYLLPSLFSRAILLAYLLSRLERGVAGSTTWAVAWNSTILRGMRGAIALLILGGLLARPIDYAISRPQAERPGSRDTAYGYRDLPIAMQFSHDFLERFQYSPERSRYFFILDWEAASDPTGGLFAPQEYKHLEAIRRNYGDVFGNNIIEGSEFLRKHQRFLVLTFRNADALCGVEKVLQNGHCARWFPMRILHDPAYETTEIGEVGDRKLWLVVAKTPSTHST